MTSVTLGGTRGARSATRSRSISTARIGAPRRRQRQRQRAGPGPISRNTSPGAGAIAATHLLRPRRREKMLAEPLARTMAWIHGRSRSRPSRVRRPVVVVLVDRPRRRASTLFDLFDFFLGQPEVVADLVDQRLADRHDDVVFVLARVLDRALKQRDLVRQRVAVRPLPLGERRALVQAEQRVRRLDADLVEQLAASARPRRRSRCSASRRGTFCGMVAQRLVDELRGIRRESCGVPSSSVWRARLGAERARKYAQSLAHAGSDRRAASAGRCGGRAGSACPTRASSAPAAARARARASTTSRVVGCARGRSGWPRAARDDRRAGPARRARARARRWRSCGRRRAASTSASMSPAPRRRAASTTALRHADAGCATSSRKNPVDWICGSSSSGSARGERRGVG